MRRKSLSAVVTVTGLNNETLLMYIYCDLMVAVGRCILGGGIAEAVLGSKLFGYLIVDLRNILIFLDFKEASASLLGHTFKDLLTVNVTLARIIASITATISSPWISPTTTWVATARISTARKTTPRITATAVLRVIVLWMGLLALEINGVNDGIGSLGRFDRADKILLTVSVDAIGKDDKGFASGLLAHQFV
jgi:hypothetical protein